MDEFPAKFHKSSWKGKAMPNYLELYTPQDSAVVFIDHQPQMIFGVANIAVISVNSSADSRAAKKVERLAVVLRQGAGLLSCGEFMKDGVSGL
jgi:hypothetical protein